MLFEISQPHNWKKNLLSFIFCAIATNVNKRNVHSWNKKKKLLKSPYTSRVDRTGIRFFSFVMENCFPKRMNKHQFYVYSMPNTATPFVV